LAGQRHELKTILRREQYRSYPLGRIRRDARMWSGGTPDGSSTTRTKLVAISVAGDLGTNSAWFTSDAEGGDGRGFL